MPSTPTSESIETEERSPRPLFHRLGVPWFPARRRLEMQAFRRLHVRNGVKHSSTLVPPLRFRALLPGQHQVPCGLATDWSCLRSDLFNLAFRQPHQASACACQMTPWNLAVPLQKGAHPAIWQLLSGNGAAARAVEATFAAIGGMRLAECHGNFLHVSRTCPVSAYGGGTTFDALQRRVWGPGKGDLQAARSAVTKLRRKLGDDARNPRHILGERGLGDRMPEPGERQSASQRRLWMLRILARTDAASDTPARASMPSTLSRYRGKRSDSSLNPL